MIAVIDVNGEGNQEPETVLESLRKELHNFNPVQQGKMKIVVFNKIDVLEDKKLKTISSSLEKEGQVFPISAVSGDGMRPLVLHLGKLLEEESILS